MKTFSCLAFTALLYGLVRPDIFNTNSSENRNEVVVTRQKRYLTFEKGATFTGNIAKSLISGSPRGLNEIAEYTLVYDLPTDLMLIKNKLAIGSTTTTTTSTTTAMPPEYAPWSYQWNRVPGHIDRNDGHRKYSKCRRWNFYEFRGKLTQMCLKRTKRVPELHSLTTSQRMFYDILEKWSQMHGFLSRYCFMRTLCESRHLLLPHGHSLLHDVIHILLSYTTPWAFHHKTFGRSLKQRHSIDDCAKLYGPHCRVSWLSYVTTAVHGSRADFVR